MTKELAYFERIMTHYITLALARSGVTITTDIDAELRGAFDDLRASLDESFVKQTIGTVGDDNSR